MTLSAEEYEEYLKLCILMYDPMQQTPHFISMKTGMVCNPSCSHNIREYEAMLKAPFRERMVELESRL